MATGGAGSNGERMFPLYDTVPHRRFPWITLLIIVANVAILIWVQRLPPRQYAEFVVQHGFVPKRLQQLSDPKLVVPVDIGPMEENRPVGLPAKPDLVQLPANPPAIYASMFTMMFLHAGWLHLLSNMWFLWIFGNNVEDRLGHFIFLFFYVLGGLFALFLHWAIEPNSTMPVLGASGAVAAVLGAYAITYPTAKVRTLIFLGLVFLVDIPALVFLGLWFVLQLLEGLAVLGGAVEGGVAWWAHVGGFAAGLILMPILSLGSTPPDEDWHNELERGFGPRPDA